MARTRRLGSTVDQVFAEERRAWERSVLADGGEPEADRPRGSGATAVAIRLSALVGGAIAGAFAGQWTGDPATGAALGIAAGLVFGAPLAERRG